MYSETVPPEVVTLFQKLVIARFNLLVIDGKPVSEDKYKYIVWYRGELNGDPHLSSVELDMALRYGYIHSDPLNVYPTKKAYPIISSFIRTELAKRRKDVSVDLKGYSLCPVCGKGMTIEVGRLDCKNPKCFHARCNRCGSFGELHVDSCYKLSFFSNIITMEDFFNYGEYIGLVKLSEKIGRGRAEAIIKKACSVARLGDVVLAKELDDHHFAILDTNGNTTDLKIGDVHL